MLAVVGVGSFCFADDTVLLARCTSALRKMLSLCTIHAASHGLIFNNRKNQLIFCQKLTCFALKTYLVVVPGSKGQKF